MNNNQLFTHCYVIFICHFLVAIKEFKRTAYNHIKATVIGSREQLCIQEKFKRMSNTDKISGCKCLRKKKECEFYSGGMMYEMSKELPTKFQKDVMDIEDLRKAGKEHTRCPFYAARVIAEKAQVIFMPYNVSDIRLVDLLLLLHFTN